MSERRREIDEAWDAAQARDREMLPHVDRVVRPGPFGTYPERTRQGGPHAPTLDDGPLYTGEGREEVDGASLICPSGATVWTPLASLRRPWPKVGFAVDLSQFASGVTITAGLRLLTRSGPAMLYGNVLGVIPFFLTGVTPIVPGQGWVALSGASAGMRCEVVINHTAGSPVKVRANLWGYNEPSWGP